MYTETTATLTVTPRPLKLALTNIYSEPATPPSRTLPQSPAEAFPLLSPLPKTPSLEQSAWVLLSGCRDPIPPSPPQLR